MVMVMREIGTNLEGHPPLHHVSLIVSSYLFIHSAYTLLHAYIY